MGLKGGGGGCCQSAGPAVFRRVGLTGWEISGRWWVGGGKNGGCDKKCLGRNGVVWGRGKKVVEIFGRGVWWWRSGRKVRNVGGFGGAWEGVVGGVLGWWTGDGKEWRKLCVWGALQRVEGLVRLRPHSSPEDARKGFLFRVNRECAHELTGRVPNPQRTIGSEVVSRRRSRTGV